MAMGVGLWRDYVFVERWRILLGMIIGGVITGLYAWGYFKLLRNLADNLMLWLLVFLAGPVFPFVLFAILLNAADKAA